MGIAELREKLHDYIDAADEQHLSAIYVLVGDAIVPDANEIYDDATMKMLYERRNNHKNGASASFTVEESSKIVRSQK